MVDIRDLVTEVGELHEKAVSYGLVSPERSQSEMVADIHGAWSDALYNWQHADTYCDGLANGAIRLMDIAYMFNVSGIVHKEFEIVTTSDVFDDFADNPLPDLINLLHLQTCQLFEVDYMHFKFRLESMAETIGDMLGMISKWLDRHTGKADFNVVSHDFCISVTRELKYLSDEMDGADTPCPEDKEADVNDHT